MNKVKFTHTFQQAWFLSHTRIYSSCDSVGCNRNTLALGRIHKWTKHLVGLSIVYSFTRNTCGALLLEETDSLDWQPSAIKTASIISTRCNLIKPHSHPVRLFERFIWTFWCSNGNCCWNRDDLLELGELQSCWMQAEASYFSLTSAVDTLYSTQGAQVCVILTCPVLACPTPEPRCQCAMDTSPTQFAPTTPGQCTMNTPQNSFRYSSSVALASNTSSYFSVVLLGSSSCWNTD